MTDETTIIRLDTEIDLLGNLDNLTTSIVANTANIRLLLERMAGDLPERSAPLMLISRVLDKVDHLEAQIGEVERQAYIRDDIIALQQALITALTEQRDEAIRSLDDVYRDAYEEGRDAGIDEGIDAAMQGVAQIQAELDAEPDPSQPFDVWAEWHDGLSADALEYYLGKMKPDALTEYEKWTNSRG